MKNTANLKNPLGEKIKQELKKGKTYKQLGKEFIVSPSIFCFIVKDRPWYYSEEILDYLYSVFHLKKDNRYYAHIKYKWKKPIAWFFAKLREEKTLSAYEICKKLKISEKEIRRIENAKLNYKTSKTMKQLIDFYNLQDWEKKLLKISVD